MRRGVQARKAFRTVATTAPKSAKSDLRTTTMVHPACLSSSRRQLSCAALIRSVVLLAVVLHGNHPVIPGNVEAEGPAADGDLKVAHRSRDSVIHQESTNPRLGGDSAPGSRMGSALRAARIPLRPRPHETRSLSSDRDARPERRMTSPIATKSVYDTSGAQSIQVRAGTVIVTPPRSVRCSGGSSSRRPRSPADRCREPSREVATAHAWASMSIPNPLGRATDQR